MTIKQVKWWKTFFSTFYVLGTKLAGTFYQWPYCLIIHLSWTLSALTFQDLQGQALTSQTFCKFPCATYQKKSFFFFLWDTNCMLHWIQLTHPPQVLSSHFLERRSGTRVHPFTAVHAGMCIQQAENRIFEIIELLAWGKICNRMHKIESMLDRPWTSSVHRSLRVPFSLDELWVGAVKGLLSNKQRN